MPNVAASGAGVAGQRGAGGARAEFVYAGLVGGGGCVAGGRGALSCRNDIEISCKENERSDRVADDYRIEYACVIVDKKTDDEYRSPIENRVTSSCWGLSGDWMESRYKAMAVVDIALPNAKVAVLSTFFGRRRRLALFRRLCVETSF